MIFLFHWGGMGHREHGSGFKTQLTEQCMTGRPSHTSPHTHTPCAVKTKRLRECWETWHTFNVCPQKAPQQPACVCEWFEPYAEELCVPICHETLVTCQTELLGNTNLKKAQQQTPGEHLRITDFVACNREPSDFSGVSANGALYYFSICYFLYSSSYK